MLMFVLLCGVLGTSAGAGYAMLYVFFFFSFGMIMGRTVA